MDPLLRLVFAALGLLALGSASCRRKPAAAEHVEAEPVASAVASHDAVPALAPVNPGRRCTRLAPIHVPERGAFGSVQNVRIATDGSSVLVTWEALDEPLQGDSSQVGLAAFGKTTPSGELSFTPVALPARGYAAAVYTSVGPSRIRGALDLFTYGVAGVPSFEAFAFGPGPWKGLEPFEGAGPAPVHQTTLPVSVAEPIVVSEHGPLAIVAGLEAPCESYYRCEKKYDEAMQRGLPKAVRSLSLAADKVHSEILFRGTPKLPAKRFAPALATRGARSFALYRVDDRLEGAWLDERGQKERGFVVARAADLGAPAVAFVGDALYAAWAERADARKPYQLKLARIRDGSADAPLTPSTGTESAFAPSISPIGADLAVAWMEGSDESHGRIRLGVLSLERASLESVVDVGSGGGNRRDPELAARGDRLYLVYADFTSKKRGSVELERFDCR